MGIYFQKSKKPKGLSRLEVLLIIPAVIAAALLLTAVHAALFKKEEPRPGAFEKENVNTARAAEHLSEAIRIRTVSCEDESQTDWAEFEKFHDFLEKSYPLITKNLKREKISKASLLYEWTGERSDVEPIAFDSNARNVEIGKGQVAVASAAREGIGLHHGLVFDGDVFEGNHM